MRFAAGTLLGLSSLKVPVAATCHRAATVHVAVARHLQLG